MRAKARVGWMALLSLACSESPTAPPLPPAPPAVVDAGAAPSSDAGLAAVPAEQGLFGKVGKVTGQVEVQRAGEGWVELTLGAPIRMGEKVRTAEGGEVELIFGGTILRVAEDSDVELTLLTEQMVKVSLTGSGEAQLKDGEVAFSAGDAVASAKSGRLSLTFDGQSATAAALEGEAQFSAGGKSVLLKAGQFSTARAGALGKPTKLPKAVALLVAWPEQAITNKNELYVRGKASPQARLLVNGKKVQVTGDGRFEARVPLKRGKQNVTVVAIDPAGRKVVRSKAVVMDPDAPSIKAKVEYK
jgi:hypothetical protein